jgi:hypothetical protein
LIKTITAEKIERRVCRIKCSGVIIVAGFLFVSLFIAPFFGIEREIRSYTPFEMVRHYLVS